MLEGGRDRLTKTLFRRHEDGCDPSYILSVKRCQLAPNYFEDVTWQCETMPNPVAGVIFLTSQVPDFSAEAFAVLSRLVSCSSVRAFSVSPLFL